MPTSRLDGSVVVVTGGTRGLGLEICRHLASQGASLALCSRDGDHAISTADHLASAHGVETLGAGVDVASPDEVAAFAQQVSARFGRTDAVVNNAAVVGPVGRTSEVAPADWRRAIDINVLGALHTMSSFGPLLEASPAGRVVNLSGGGVGGPSPMRRTSAYVVSKFAVVALTEAAADDFADTTVTVNAVAPGAIPTTFLDDVVAAGAAAAGDALFADASGRVGRSPEPHHVQPFLDLLDYLLSAESGWISGRMLSARWETPDRLRSMQASIGPAAFRLRRIDGDLFEEVAR
jgi:NAD(P)-dependent dehydrogenase (short-subunit alcohol dehydrogenase family)